MTKTSEEKRRFPKEHVAQFIEAHLPRFSLAEQNRYARILKKILAYRYPFFYCDPSKLIVDMVDCLQPEISSDCDAASS
jgi:hypothetical protein